MDEKKKTWIIVAIVAVIALIAIALFTGGSGEEANDDRPKTSGDISIEEQLKFEVTQWNCGPYADSLGDLIPTNHQACILGIKITNEDQDASVDIDLSKQTIIYNDTSYSYSPEGTEAIGAQSGITTIRAADADPSKNIPLQQNVVFFIDTDAGGLDWTKDATVRFEGPSGQPTEIQLKDYDA